MQVPFEKLAEEMERRKEEYQELLKNIPKTIEKMNQQKFMLENRMSFLNGAMIYHKDTTIKEEDLEESLEQNLEK